MLHLIQHHPRPRSPSKQHDVIANLATATATKCTAVANLTTTNAVLEKDLPAIIEKLVTAITKIASVTQKLSDCREVNKGGGSVHSSLNKNYCWSCGYHSGHSSWYCIVPNPEHQKMAKAYDIMGGLQTNKSS